MFGSVSGSLEYSRGFRTREVEKPRGKDWRDQVRAEYPGVTVRDSQRHGMCRIHRATRFTVTVITDGETLNIDVKWFFSQYLGDMKRAVRRAINDTRPQSVQLEWVESRRGHGRFKGIARHELEAWLERVRVQLGHYDQARRVA